MVLHNQYVLKMFTPTKVKEEADGLSADKSEKARKGLRNISYLPTDV